MLWLSYSGDLADDLTDDLTRDLFTLKYSIRKILAI